MREGVDDVPEWLRVAKTSGQNEAALDEGDDAHTNPAGVFSRGAGLMRERGERVDQTLERGLYGCIKGATQAPRRDEDIQKT